MNRKTDNHNGKIFFQMDRFVQQNSEWFYMLREGGLQGPFLTKDEAEENLTTFLIDINYKERFGIQHTNTTPT